MYWVYILRCRDGALYTGITTDVRRRLVQHKAGMGGAYTRAHGAVKMVYTQRRRTRGSALSREASIKRLTRAQKQKLISSR